MITKVINVNLHQPIYERLTAKQGDIASRYLLFHLLDGDKPFDLSNRTVRVYAIKPDKTEIFNDLTINDASKGYCTLELTSQCLASAGVVKMELYISESGKVLTSIPFELEVIACINTANGVVSTNEFSALEAALGSLQDYDNLRREIVQARKGHGTVGKRLDTIETKKANKDDVAKLSSGTPLFVGSVEEMTDTTKNYVNTTDGYLYIYNGSNFENSNIKYLETGLSDEQIKYSHFNYEIKNLIKSDTSYLDERIVTSDEIEQFNTSGFTISNGVLTYDGIINSGESFCGIYLKELNCKKYSYVIKKPFSDAQNQFWHIYKIDNDDIYILQTKADGIVTIKCNKNSPGGTIIDTISTENVGIINGDTITVEINNNTHEYYHNGTLMATLNDCNSVGILSSKGISSSVEFVSGFNKYVTVNKLYCSADDILYNGVKLTKVLDEKSTISYLTGKKIIFMGDSLTMLNSPHTTMQYYDYIKQWYNTTNIVDGQSGSQIRDDGKDSSRAFSNRYVNLPDECDIVIVFGGTNDWNVGQNGTLGTIDSTDNTTFYGAMNVLCEGLLNKYPDKLIVFMLPFKHFKEPNRTRNEAMKEVLMKNSIPCIDLWEVGGINPNNEKQKSIYMKDDNIHFNELANEKIANLLVGFINSLVR